MYSPHSSRHCRKNDCRDTVHARLSRETPREKGETGCKTTVSWLKHPPRYVVNNVNYGLSHDEDLSHCGRVPAPKRDEIYSRRRRYAVVETAVPFQPHEAWSDGSVIPLFHHPAQPVHHPDPGCFHSIVPIFQRHTVGCWNGIDL